MRIFGEMNLRDYLEYRIEKLRQEIQSEQPAQLLNVEIDQYIQYLKTRYDVDPLVINWDGMVVSTEERSVGTDEAPRDFHFRRPGTVVKQHVIYEIPYSGEQDLLRAAPSSRLLWGRQLRVTPSNICIEIVNWRDDPEEIKRALAETLGPLRQQSENVNREVRQWREQLEQCARQAVEARKQQLLKQANLLANLGVPIRRSDSVPDTFTVPATPRRISVRKPSASTSSFRPEPTLDPSTYRHILELCGQMGIEMERHPAVYAQKDEEALRDHFLMILSPHFQSASGETFNRGGKTDILIRHEGKNLFVAECKFWRGAKSFHEAIDQLLGYLTWRDSKTAMLLFVDRKDIGPVLSKIKTAAREHPCFVTEKESRTEGRTDLRMHLPDDDSRGVDLSVLAFHFPK